MPQMLMTVKCGKCKKEMRLAEKVQHSRFHATLHFYCDECQLEHTIEERG